MRVRRGLLWIFPTLAIFSGVLLYFLPQALERADHGFQERKEQSWVRDLGSFAAPGMRSSLGERDGEIAIAPDGKIWVAGGNSGLMGLHYYDGSKWIDRPGDYSDLALGPNGEVWAAPFRGESMEVFDGKEWKSYQVSGLDSEREYPQVEIDSNGRAWYVTEESSRAWLSEMKIEDGVLKAGTAITDVRNEHGAIVSVDADRQGGVWASVWTYGMGPPAASDGLKFFDGETWERVEVPGDEPVRRTVFDRDGAPWILTDCGSVMHYVDNHWEVVMEGPVGRPDCYQHMEADGIFVDDRARLWAWRDTQLRFLEAGTWTTLPQQNLGFEVGEDFERVFGVAVDEQDRVWIGTSKGVSMANMKDLQLLSKWDVLAHRARVRVRDLVRITWWVVPSVLVFLWLAAEHKVLPGVVLASVLGLGGIVILGLLEIWVLKGDAVLYFGFVLSSLFGLYLGMLSGLLFGLRDQQRKMAGSTRRGVVPALAGWLVGSIAGLGLSYFMAIYGAL